MPPPTGPPLPPAWHPSNGSHSLLAIMWALTAAAVICLISRLHIVRTRFKRFYWDDYLVTFAFLTALPLVIQPTLVDAGAKVNPHLINHKHISQSFFYVSLWSAKFSCLVFFRRIGGIALPGLRRYWHAVFIYTVISFFAVFAMNPWACYAKKGSLRCMADEDAVRIILVTFRLAIFFDLSTDCLIMAIPFATLWKVKITVRQRLILSFLFGLTIVTMAVALTRAILSTNGPRKPGLNLTWLLFFTHVEATTSIIVACVVSFRTLFTQDRSPRSTGYDYGSRPSRRRVQQQDADLLSATALHDPISRPAASHQALSKTEEVGHHPYHELSDVGHLIHADKDQA
ncbi:hypothetical protein P154DRAFT_536085 [Amniculicola lignicola CBS 123094]|uniref:Rhodopsin domain-containing protein n=1 Tax=Amniculicola lignicola CBS 123094 TaxID=1392246 RepID=A0A6A5WF49_9PLEO|nr:hypothetical protein P154DRAFT_536085 [Amniculicola lignicola CBS 123094]